MYGPRQRLNHVLVEEASSTKVKEAAIDGHVEVRILEIDQRSPIVGTKKGRRILDRIHPEVGSVKKRPVEPLQVDNGPPAAVFLGRRTSEKPNRETSWTLAEWYVWPGEKKHPRPRPKSEPAW